MNKRFFTLMVAALLAGAPFANQAFAATSTPQVATIDASTALANGLKFVLKNSGYASVTPIENTNYVAIVPNGAVDDNGNPDLSKATKFVIKGYANKTFQLFTENGKQIALKNANGTYTTFYAAAGTTPTDKANFTAIYTSAVGETGTAVVTGVTPVSMSKIYTADDFDDYNRNAVTLSFNATNVEGNAFVGVKAFTFTGGQLAPGSAAGTYFVSGDATYIKKLGEAESVDDRAAALKKLNVVYVNNAKYDINALVKGEGYKIAAISGAEFYNADATKAAKFENAAFISIEEGDQLNNQGSLVMKIQPTLGTTDEPITEVLRVAAVKASASDTKTYVTTLNKDNAVGSTLKAIYPTLGGNTFFAASEFVKKGGASAYNIMFTSGDKSTEDNQTVYGKYLVSTCLEQDHWIGNWPTDADLLALAPNAVDVTTPYAQWIVTGFDGRYTLTLKNRMSRDELQLVLEATDKAGEYYVNSDLNYDAQNNENVVFVGAVTGNNQSSVSVGGNTIKLIPTTLGSSDGFMTLSEADRKEGLKISFTGASAQLGTPIYYAEKSKFLDDSGNYVTKLNVDGAKATAYNFNLYEPATATEADDYMLVTKDYLYLDAAGQMAFENDTLFVPAYTISESTKVGSQVVTKYAGSDLWITIDPTAQTPNKFVIMKALNGKYVMVTNNSDDEAVYIHPSGQWINDDDGANICQPDDSDFPYVSFIVNDNSDKTTLPAVSRHITFENALGSVSFQENKNGILEGILAAEPMTFWLDSADTDAKTPSFYISKGIATEETPETKADEVAMRNFLFYATDSLNIFDEGSAIESINKKYVLEGTEKDLKAIFRPAALIAEDTLASVVAGKEVTVVTKDADAKKGQVNGLKSFQYGICLADEAVADEYVIYSKADNSKYLYSLNGKLGFTDDAKKALVVTLGAGDPTANEAIEAESGIEVIGGQGVVTVQGAAGKVITVANILGQTIANQVAASDNVTIAAPAGIVVVSVDGDATKVIVK